jgi:hypothetical protein
MHIENNNTMKELESIFIFNLTDSEIDKLNNQQLADAVVKQYDKVVNFFIDEIFANKIKETKSFSENNISELNTILAEKIPDDIAYGSALLRISARMMIIRALTKAEFSNHNNMFGELFLKLANYSPENREKLKELLKKDNTKTWEI